MNPVGYRPVVYCINTTSATSERCFEDRRGSLREARTSPGLFVLLQGQHRRGHGFPCLPLYFGMLVVVLIFTIVVIFIVVVVFIAVVILIVVVVFIVVSILLSLLYSLSFLFYCRCYIPCCCHLKIFIVCVLAVLQASTSQHVPRLMTEPQVLV